MECTICERKFNSLSSFYRHNWSDKHLLMCQIKEYEKEINVLQRKSQINESLINELSQCQNISEKRPIQVQDPFKMDLDKKIVEML